MNQPTDAMHKQARAETDPLFFQDYFMAHGHDVNTKNATATYVQYEGRVFAVTCRHVIEILQERKRQNHSRFPSLALIVDRSLLNLAFFTGDGLHSAMKLPKSEAGEEALDLASAHISSSYWAILQTRKGKRAIDLDKWHEPRWAHAQMLAAAGYPDEHKTTMVIDGEQKVGAPMALVCANIDGKIDKRQTFVKMRSRLDQPHGTYFSGMSGGPMYVQQDEKLIAVGILYEGWPQTSNRPVIFDEAGTKVLFDVNDIIVHGLTLTPERFGDWLKASGLKV